MKKSLLRKLLLLICSFSLSDVLVGQNFTCNSDLYQVVDGRDLKLLDPATGVYQTIGTSSINYNGAGYNYEDDYIYGIGSGTRLVRIDNTGEATDLGGISGFSAISYSGDLDTLGNWYSFRRINGNWLLNRIDVSSLPPVAQELPMTEIAGVATASNTNDIAYNSVTNMFYGMSAGQLIEFDPYNQTVRSIADYSSITDGGGYGAVWSDVDGNTYFFNNGTGNIYRASFDPAGTILSFAFVSTSAPNGSNDGMSCSLAPPPVFPEICNNGIDDDGDGLTDCEDPDCTANESCGIAGVIESSSFACESSIATYHIFFTNNSALDNTITISETLPTGFVFLQDTIAFDGAGSNAGTYQPIDGDIGTLQWGPLTLRGGETVKVSYDVTLNGSASNGINSNNVTLQIGTVGTNAYPPNLTSSIIVDDCPTPATYTCEPAFYQVYKKKGKNQPNVYGRLNPETGDYDQIAIASDYANALGFDTNTGLVFGTSGNRFIQLDANGLVIDQGISFSQKVYKGDIDQSGKWYGVVGSDMVKVDVTSTPFIEDTYPGQGLPGWDIAFNEDGNFYSVHNQTLYVYETVINTRSTLGAITGTNLPTSGGFGAQWTGSDGKLYISHNQSGQIIQVDVQTREARVVSTSIDGLSKNDGFSCPTEIPVVFEYDLSDNNRLPQSRVLAYRQDLSSDGIPDYSTVWVGNTVTYDITDPQNANADGDLDDGFNLATEIDDGELAIAVGLNANQTTWAYHLIGIDWDDSGSFDEIISDSTLLSGAETLLSSIAVPEGFTSGNINLRILISEEQLSPSDISGDIQGMGEVEDYRYSITSPCVGEGCDIPSGSGGGLESNGNLASAISKRNYLRAKENFNGNVKAKQTTLHQMIKAGTADTEGLHQYFPSTGIKGMEEARVSSPSDLLTLTNATDVFALDYYEKDARVAASLVLTTEGEVYNHSKNVCDRLHGKSITDVQLANIDGIRIIYAKIIHETGVVEYSAWFAAEDLGNQYRIQSLWSVDDYPQGDYLNFQAWGSSPSQVFHILGHALNKMKAQKEVINDDTIQQLPELFVQNGAYSNGKLSLMLFNKTGASSVTINANLRKTEFSSYEPFTTEVALSGQKNEFIEIAIGSIFDAGFSLQIEDVEMSDVLYLADGAWGTDFNPALSTITNFSIQEESRSNLDDGYSIERGFSISGKSEDVINVFRNVRAGDRTLSLAPFSTVSFNITNTHPIELVIVEKDLREWENRIRTTIPAYPDGKYVTLRLDNFDGTSSGQMDAVQSIVFSYLNQSGSPEKVSTEVSDMKFGNDVDNVLGAIGEEVTITVYPNPATKKINVQLIGDTNDQYEVSMIDSSGKTLSRLQGKFLTELRNEEIVLNNIDPGIYFIKVKTSKSETTQKILITK